MKLTNVVLAYDVKLASKSTSVIAEATACEFGVLVPYEVEGVRRTRLVPWHAVRWADAQPGKAPREKPESA